MLETDDSYFIPSSYSRIIARELRLQERDLPSLLQGTGLAKEILLPGDETRLSGRQQLQVMNNAQRMENSPDFGLRLGRQLHPSAHGALGYLSLSSPDLITSLESLRDFLPTRLPLVTLAIDHEPRWLRCTLTIRLEANSDETRVMADTFALVIQSFTEAVLGRAMVDARVELVHRKPAYYSLYKEYLHSPVRFGCRANCFLIPVKLAREPNASGDPDAYAMAQEMCRKLLEQVPATARSTSDRVRSLLLSKAPGSVTETEVAGAMFVSKRTLARRLAAEGSSYRRVREQLLSELARRHLRESRLSVEAVATLLGYNDTAAFRKAFRRWYGQSPKAFRDNKHV